MYIDQFEIQLIHCLLEYSCTDILAEDLSPQYLNHLSRKLNSIIKTFK